MSQSLTERLKKAVEFDEARAILELPLGLSAVDPNDVGNQLLRQVKRENTRLQPILTALIECVAALESVSANKTQTVYSHSEDFRQGANVAFGQSAERADEALSRLEKELGGEYGKDI